MRYTGEWRQGKWHGWGRLHTVMLEPAVAHDRPPLLMRVTSVYTGEFRSGDRHGQGRILYSRDNDIDDDHDADGAGAGAAPSSAIWEVSYMGQWVDDEKCGSGEQRDSHHGVWSFTLWRS